MKILHLYKDYFPVLGGIENHVKAIAEYQACRGFDVTVLVTSPNRISHEETIGSVRVLKAGRLCTIARTPISLSFVRHLRANKPAIVHLHFPYPFGELANLLYGTSPRCVLTYHSDIVRQRLLLRFYGPFLERVMKRADRIVATSPRYVETSPVLTRFGSKCRIVPLGINLERFLNCTSGKPEGLRVDYGDRPVVLFVGRLTYFKGLDYLISAMRQVNGVLLIAGDGTDGPRLRSIVSREMLADKVFFLGSVPDDQLPTYYHLCDLFVLPSSHRSEAFGTVLLEAMACGKAVVSTELGTGTSFVNIHRKTGLVVPPRDPDALASAITVLLGNGALRKELGRNARKRAAEFTADRMNEGILRVYEEVFKGESVS